MLETIQSFFLRNLVPVFFVYGLSFLIMFAAIVTWGRESARFGLMRSFTFLAGFGLLHGLTEWTDMVRLLVMSPKPLVVGLAVLKLGLLVGSFQSLLYFAFEVLTSARSEERRRWQVYISPLLVIAYAAIIYYALKDIGLGELAARYALGFTGAGLACLAFANLSHKFSLIGLEQPRRHALFVAFAFGVYAIFAGLMFVPSGQPVLVLGVPVQIFRAACAILIAFFVARLLIFFRR
ncbi:MAG: hypothetical protein AB1566_11925 [Chloroflexota bacterium]